jgi:UDP-N-acetylmuramate dehydrogenase
MEIREKVKLAYYTTFGIGGDAKFFVSIANTPDAYEVLNLAKGKNLPIFVLGGGSNVLVSDDGFDGMVIKNEILGFEVSGREVTIGAGENWDDVVARTIAHELQGIECLSGIPGTFGGAVVQNIGAYGQTLAKVVESVEALEIETGERKNFKKDECEFEYRNSLFKKNPGKYLITKAVLKLNNGGIPDITYPSVAKRFMGERPTLQEVRDAVIQIRAEKGMVILPQFEILKSAGSYFKNPIVDKKQFERITHMINCPDPWHWAEGPKVKISAACLIIQAGFSKGQMIGKAQISPFQPLALVNPDNANAEDVKFTATHIKLRVKEKFDIDLEEEVIYV